MPQTAETRTHRPAPQREDAAFNWQDPLDFEGELTQEERMVRDTARGYAQDKLFSRVLMDNREERFDRAIVSEMGALGLLGPTIPATVRPCRCSPRWSCIRSSPTAARRNARNISPRSHRARSSAASA